MRNVYILSNACPYNTYLLGGHITEFASEKCRGREHTDVVFVNFPVKSVEGESAPDVVFMDFCVHHRRMSLRRQIPFRW